MSGPMNRALLLSASACLLAACGGGGGAGGVASIPTPTPIPVPPGAYLTPGISQSTDFATLGWELDAGDTQLSDLATTGFTVSYDAATQKYTVALPSYQGAPGSVFEPLLTQSAYTGVISGGMNPISIGFRRPGAYQYTNIGSVELMRSSPSSVFAFGLATPASAMPVTGSASYAADVEGTTFSNAYYFRGTATLNFNFASGTLDGSMGLGIYDLSGGFLPLGTYDLVNTVYGSGSTSFSGGLRNSANGLTGAFTGLFAGPNAQELMARWNANYVNPDSHQTETAVGALIGRRVGGP